NHSRFLFDFAPESIILRVTQDAAPRLLYCFETCDDGKTVLAPSLVERIEEGDIAAGGAVLGGCVRPSAPGAGLRGRGAAVPESGGVKSAVAEAIRQINNYLGSKG